MTFSRRGEGAARNGPMRPMSDGRSGLVTGMALSKTGATRYDFSDPYHLALTIGWPAFTAAVLVAFALINVAFAVAYLSQPQSIANLPPGSFIDAFFYSIECLGTVGTGRLYPENAYGHGVGAAEIVAGMAYTTIVTGLIFVRFSRPKAKIVYAGVAVIARHNGCPTLMYRIGNGRMNLLTDTLIRVTALTNEVSQEGVRFRYMCDLELIRSRFAAFALTLTVMHPIDRRSPLHGKTLEELEDDDVRFFVSIEARDPALGAVVTDLHSFAIGDCRVGRRYRDAVHVSGKGQAEVDLNLVSSVEEDPAWVDVGGRLVCD
jgi:inward rectifier potassium channel